MTYRLLQDKDKLLPGDEMLTSTGWAPYVLSWGRTTPGRRLDDGGGDYVLLDEGRFGDGLLVDVGDDVWEWGSGWVPASSYSMLRVLSNSTVRRKRVKAEESTPASKASTTEMLAVRWAVMSAKATIYELFMKESDARAAAESEAKNTPGESFMLVRIQPVASYTQAVIVKELNG